MNAQPKPSPALLLEVPRAEAMALCRALARAVAANTEKGHALDAQRLEALLDCMQGALDGTLTIRKVEE